MSRAFVFPGQGAQTIGMGQELAQSYASARAVFQEVDAALGEGLSDLIWNGDIETLTLTQNAQPALFAMSLAALAVLAEEGITPAEDDFVAGHSLGEYSALAAAGCFSISDGARLLRIRGRAMQEAVPVGEGAMAAILGLDFAAVSDVAQNAAQGEVCQAANDNDPAQVVVSGNKAAVERAIDLAKEAGARRALLLPVSAPFHCALMAPAAERMKEALAEVTFAAPKVQVVPNVRASTENDPQTLRQLLIEQVTGVVRWRETVQFMAQSAITQAYEVGAGAALSGMIRRIAKEIPATPVGKLADIEKMKA